MKIEKMKVDNKKQKRLKITIIMTDDDKLYFFSCDYLLKIHFRFHLAPCDNWLRYSMNCCIRPGIAQVIFSTIIFMLVLKIWCGIFLADQRSFLLMPQDGNETIKCVLMKTWRSCACFAVKGVREVRSTKIPKNVFCKIPKNFYSQYAIFIHF